MTTFRAYAQAWTPDQADIAATLARSRRLCVPSANAVGKTFLAADLAVSHALTQPNSITLLTAPTRRQVRQLLWSEIKRRLASLGLPTPAEPDVTLPNDARIIGIATTTAERLQGLHATSVLAIADESAGLSSETFYALESIALSARDRILAIGNPSARPCFFQRICASPHWTCRPLSALTHPNIAQPAHPPIPGAVSLAAFEAALAEHCRPCSEPSDTSFEYAGARYEPDDTFRARFLGLWPIEATAALFTAHAIDAAMRRAPRPSSASPILGIDPARTGGCKTAWALRHGDTIGPIGTLPPSDLVQTSSRVLNLAAATSARTLIVDATGLGAGLADMLRAAGAHVIEFQSAAAPPPHAARHASNLRTYAYHQLARILPELTLPDNPILREELLATTATIDAAGRTKLRSKDQIALTLGRSPDLADAVALTAIASPIVITPRSTRPCPDQY